MLIHKKIRQKLTALLKGAAVGVNEVYSGRPLFIDIDQEQSAVAVFIDAIQAEPVDLCHYEYIADLNIATYLKTAIGEDALDEIAEKIKKRLESAVDNEELPEEITEITLSGYEYEQDTTNRTWFVSNLKYQIKYED